MFVMSEVPLHSSLSCFTTTCCRALNPVRREARGQHIHCRGTLSMRSREPLGSYGRS